jgi:hypothetical protein
MERWDVKKFQEVIGTYLSVFQIKLSKYCVAEMLQIK